MKKYLITSALPYINGIKHLGNLVGSMLPADVYARHLRQQGEDVLYICGTDEHGTPAEIAAHENNQSVDEFCEAMYQTQKDIYDRFSLSFDYFGRSSDESNHRVTQEIFKQLDQAGYIKEETIKQFFSIDDNRFLPDRYVEGTCPHCQYDRARGDQCESCGRLLDPLDLVNPRSAITKDSTLEVRETSHLFLKLSDLHDQVATWVESKSDWPELTKGIARKWIAEGLNDRCITRDNHWGISVPKANFEDKKFYVWFDAPMAYISMTQDWAREQQTPEAWQDWWKQSDDVYYCQFMAKDNIPFHAVFWPAMLLGAGADWKMVDYIKGMNWLNYEKGKFSTSQRRGVFTDQALELFCADYWRYYLTAVSPESSDSNFTFEHFAEVINSDLANNLGNLASRVVALIVKYFDGQSPKVTQFSIVTDDHFAFVNQKLDGIDLSLRNMKYVQAVNLLRELWSFGNEFITEKEPWALVKTDTEAAGEVLSFCVHLIKVFAVASAAIIPNLSNTLLEIIGIEEKANQISFSEAKAFLNAEKQFNVTKPATLFERIPKEKVEELVQLFSGG